MRIAIPLTLAMLTACGSEPPPTAPAPNRWEARLGREVTLEGTAINWKVGPSLDWKDGGIWIDGFRHWPEELHGRRLRVTGVVIRKSDLPVFIPDSNELPKAGIPVEPGTDLEKARVRYLLSSARWTVLD